MGGSGGGTQTSTNTASYPAEFKPLAKSAVSQIQGLQNMLPLAQFGQAHPGQTAGIAPFQQATMNFLPQLLAPSWGLETLQNLGQPINQLAGNAIGVGNQNTPFSNALAAVSSGGFGTGRQSFPGASAPTPFNLQTPNMTQATPQPTVVGPGTEGLVPQLQNQLSSPVPSSTPVLDAQNSAPSASPISAVQGKSPGAAPVPGGGLFSDIIGQKPSSPFSSKMAELQAQYPYRTS